jgi:hypothetical protein
LTRGGGGRGIGGGHGGAKLGVVVVNVGVAGGDVGRRARRKPLVENRSIGGISTRYVVNRGHTLSNGDDDQGGSFGCDQWFGWPITLSVRTQNANKRIHIFIKLEEKNIFYCFVYFFTLWESRLFGRGGVK